MKNNIKNLIKNKQIIATYDELIRFKYYLNIKSEIIYLSAYEILAMDNKYQPVKYIDIENIIKLDRKLHEFIFKYMSIFEDIVNMKLSNLLETKSDLLIPYQSGRNQLNLGSKFDLIIRNINKDYIDLDLLELVKELRNANNHSMYFFMGQADIFYIQNHNVDFKIMNFKDLYQYLNQFIKALGYIKKGIKASAYQELKNIIIKYQRVFDILMRQEK